MRMPRPIFLVILFLPLFFTAGCSLDKGKTFLNDTLFSENTRESVPDSEVEMSSDDFNDSEEYVMAEETLTVYSEIDVSQVDANYYYNQLSEEDQLLYRQIVSGIENYETKFPIDVSNADEVHTVFSAVLMDYPEYFWLTGESTLWEINGGESYELELVFNMETEKIESYKNRIENSASEFLNTIPEGTDNYSKVKMAYDWIIASTDYQPESTHNQNILSVFLHQSSVCAGYAKAFQYLMKMLDIPCIYVTGTAGEENAMEAHAWNIVNIDGIYTEIDCTWGEPNFENPEMEEYESILYDYFCVTTAEIRRNHNIDSSYMYPECVDNSYDYYKLNHNYFEVYDKEAIEQAGWNTINAGLEYTFMKFAAEEAYLQAKTALKESNIMEDVAYQKMEWDGLYEYSYSYYYEDNMRIIKIFW